jgi:hypothetical protein
MNSAGEWPVSPLRILEIPQWYLTALQPGNPDRGFFLLSSISSEKRDCI